MRAFSFLLVLVVAAPLAAQSGPQAPGWRFGIDVAAPARVLEVNETAFPDSNDGRVTLGFGVGLTVQRLWAFRNPRARWGLSARLGTASVESAQAGTSFGAGRAFLFDAALRAEHDIGPRSALFAAAGVSHWSGPSEVSPFTEMGAILLSGEAGWHLQVSGPWRVAASAGLTRIGGAESQDIATGFVWRFFGGVTRDF
jgi:hypothetical protein